MHSKNIKNIFKTAFAALAMLVFCQASYGQSWAALHKPARDLVTQEKLEHEVSFLSDTLCQGRRTGTGGNTEAGAWIARRFGDMGLVPFDGTWSKTVRSGEGFPCHNILGFLPGTATKAHPGRYVIVGSHYDHLGTLDGRMFPGADSNASGVVAMLNVAEMLIMTNSIGISYDCNLIFVAFDGKENEMAGSYGLWDMICKGELKDPVTGTKITKDKIALMVNIDQIGSSLAPLRKGREDYIIMLGTESLKNFDRNMLETCNTTYGLNMQIGLDYYGSDGFTKVFYRISDQRVFVDNRIPAVMFTSGITMNNNKTWDTPSTLNFKAMQKRIYLIYHWIDKLL